jgi:peptide/nickel transport system substrate-binding protein
MRMIPILLLLAFGMSTAGGTGTFGGRLVIAQRAEPRTFNPFTALDAGSREVIGLLTSDLIHINRNSFQSEPALATTWSVSKDRRVYTLSLRRGVHFSDGTPFTARDVVFTFRTHLDEKVRSPHRESLIINGKPIAVTRIDDYTIKFELAAPSAGAERIFDSLAIVPQHLLGPILEKGEIHKAWSLATRPEQMAGLGPFRLKEYVPGQRIALERNPHYWKLDKLSRRLPYLDEIVYQFVGTEEAQVLHFKSGQSHMLAGISPQNFLSLKRDRGGPLQLIDLGPSLEYTFLVFNQNELTVKHDPALREKQGWFREPLFREAVSAAIDRNSIVRLAYSGLASPIWTHVTDGNKQWVNKAIPRPARSLDRARQLLRTAGFSWTSDGILVDRSNKEVAFSIVTSSSSSQRLQIATIIQDDLKQLGIKIAVVSLEFRSMLDRVFQTHDYEAAIMTLASGDTDPNAEMNVWTSKGSTRVWKLNGAAETGWERELDELMRKQSTSTSPADRRQYYDKVQYIIAKDLPVICVVSPHVLVGAADRIQNLQPSILRPYLLTNADELYFRSEAAAQR